jgi:hypothetical protein
MPPVTWPSLTWPTLAPWHLALALAAVCLVAYWLARMQADRAGDDFSNAYFYAPSQKEHHRQRRRRWRDISRAILAATVLAFALAALLYFLNG